MKEAIPKKTFEGLKSSFDEGYIIGENLIDKIITNVGQYGTFATIPADSLKPSTNYTLILRNNGEYIKGYVNEYLFEGNSTDRTFNITTNNCFICSYKTLNSISVTETRLLKSWDATSNIDIEVVFLEGDHTHLSKAELMRYIEKGTSHYEEEDYNHAGKYKVQYKVTGKNKYPTDSIGNPDLLWESSGGGTAPILYNSDEQAFYTEGHRQRCLFNLKPNTPYTVSVDIKSDGRSNYYDFLFQNHAENISHPEGLTTEWTRHFITRTTDETGYLNWVAYRYCYWKNIQIEEGTVATEYEPYKEDIKTYNLSSPLLEGDTIEDVNGVATHIKRYEKIVFDGHHENLVLYSSNDTAICFQYTYVTKFDNGNWVSHGKCFNDKGLYSGNSMSVISLTDDTHMFAIGLSDIYTYISIPKSKLTTPDKDGFKKWLQANPTTVVYPLTAPIYEPISTESILLDSYVNGHLDLSNENIPIQKTEFRNFINELAYLQSSTDYVVKFSSDNIGTAKVYLDSSVKEINVVKGINEAIITTPSTIVNNNIIIDGIGFNVSDVQVVANAIKDGDIKDFEYFKGLQSSFEDGLVTDENDENYGKYKVECKIVGKNKVDSIVRNMNHSTGRYVCSNDYNSIRGVIPLPIGTYKLSLESYDVN